MAASPRQSYGVWGVGGIPYLYTPDGAAWMSDCLHCDINDLVEKYLEKNEAVDITDLAARMAESLAELIVFVAPPEEQAMLLAHTIAHLGEMVIEKSTAGERETTH
jgi:hypothetical protein